MYTIEARNANYGYAETVSLIRREGVETETRNGKALVLPGPLFTAIHRPRERVLLCPNRGANPFLNLFDGLFHLAGLCDYRVMDQFRRDFSVHYGEENGMGHGSYGYRWREHFGYDQIDVVVEKLKAFPDDRRVVLAMWDADDDGGDDLRAVDKKDIPCNTHIYPRIVGGKLDLTVCCRSNDLIWGLYGANIVQFSLLQEYLAGRIGVGMGVLYTLSNNAHAYTKVLGNIGIPTWAGFEADPYSTVEVSPVGIGAGGAVWDVELQVLMDHVEVGGGWEEDPWFEEPWFANVAWPMYTSHLKIQKKDYVGALGEMERVVAKDWRMAGTEWIRRRMK